MSGSAVYLPIISAWITPAIGSEEGNYSGRTGLEELGENDLVSLGEKMLTHFSSIEIYIEHLYKAQVLSLQHFDSDVYFTSKYIWIYYILINTFNEWQKVIPFIKV